MQGLEQVFNDTWLAFKLGGIIVLPLSILAVVALAVVIEKALLYSRQARLPMSLQTLIEAADIDDQRLEACLSALPADNYFRRFLVTIWHHRSRPLWWSESRAADEAQLIERALASRLWILETIVTAAPLLGLLGTILGMMHAFQLIGGQGLVNPIGVTGGVAQALIATAIGLLIALVALFAFNFFSRLQAQTLDEMERLGTRLLDQMRLDAQHSLAAPDSTPVNALKPAQGNGHEAA